MKLEETIKAIQDNLPGWSWLLRSVDPDEERDGKFMGHVMPPGFTNGFQMESFASWDNTPDEALENAYQYVMSAPHVRLD